MFSRHSHTNYRPDDSVHAQIFGNATKSLSRALFAHLTTDCPINSLDFSRSGLINICSAPSLEDFSMEINGMHPPPPVLLHENYFCMNPLARLAAVVDLIGKLELESRCLSAERLMPSSNKLTGNLCLHSPARPSLRLIPWKSFPSQIKTRQSSSEHGTSFIVAGSGRAAARIA